MRRAHVIASLCTVIAFVPDSSVAQTASPLPAPATSPSLVERVATDPAAIVRARVGQTFVIALRANRSTGFAWEPAAPVTPLVAPVGSAYQTGLSGSGRGDEELWLFRAVSAGAAQMTLRYVRPNGNGSSLMERAVTFHVEIAP